MSWKKRLVMLVTRLEAKADSAKGMPARQLTPEDIDTWFEAAYNPLQEKLRRKNPLRWARLQSDIKWAKKEIAKMGYDPNDVKWWR